MACGMLALISSNMYAQKSYIFLADGVEEVEATATIDALRRAGMDVISVSITENPMVTGATGQKLVADSLMSQVDFADADWIIVPGGVPGAPNLHSNQQVNSIIQIHNANDGRIASICAFLGFCVSCRCASFSTRWRPERPETPCTRRPCDGACL